VQTDIKRVIAYSTMSQIGYMFLGVGVGAYANGMFHLLTHAFFKALLFLAAGIVIHALTGEQDMRRMGGLRKLAPLTHWCFLAGALSLVGIPPFSGFFSKDSILAAALARGTFGAILWVFGIAGAFLTGVYTFRMLFLVFWGEPSAYAQEHFHKHHGREAPHEMFWPVAILAVLATIAGWIQFAPFWTPISRFLESAAPPLVDPSGTQELVSSLFAVGFGLAGIAVAWAIYSERRVAIPAAPFWRRTFEKKFYFDALYDRIFYAPAAAISGVLRREFEDPVILQTGTDIGEATMETGGVVRRIQTGFLRTYVLFLAGGAAGVVLAFLIAK
jgi:NADH-quinone oxidoreductase subunit L